MKKLILFLGLLLTHPLAGWSQNTITISGNGAPAGSCPFVMLYNRLDGQHYYYCDASSGTWVELATGTGAGTVTTTGAFTANQLVLSNSTGGTVIKTLGSLGSATTLLHGGAGAPSFSAVSLTADVSGILPVVNGGTNGLLPAANGGTGVVNTATLTLGLSNQNWATLGTGIVKNTTTTGAITDAVAADVVGLFSGCSGTKYLGADGNCYAGGTGTVTVVGSGSLTSTAIVTGGGTTTLQTPAATAIMDSSGNISTPGTITSGAGGSDAGTVSVTQGAAPTFPANSFSIFAPASIATGFGWQSPAAAASGIVRGDNSSGTVTLSQAELSGDVTTSGSNVASVVKVNGGSIPSTAKVTRTNGSGQFEAATATDINGPLIGIDSGSTDSYAATLSPAIAAYTTGACYQFIANTANTGASTLALNGLAAKAIKKAAGGITTALSDNDIRAGQVVNVCYDGTNLQMQSTLGNASAGGGGTGNAPSVVAVSFSATPTFTCPSSSASTITTFVVGTLTGNITSSTLASCTTGQVLIFQFTQDGTGGRTVAWPTGFAAACSPDPTGSVQSNIAFYWDGSNGQPLGGCVSLDTSTKFGPSPTRAAPGTPGSGSLVGWFDSTDNVFKAKNSSGTVSSTVVAKASATSHEFVTNIPTTGIQATAQPADADISFTNITTGDMTSSQHGFAPKGDGNAAHYLDGTGAFSAPAGSGCTTLAATGDWIVPGGSFSISNYQDADTNAIAINYALANTTIVFHVYIPCAFTPNNLSFYLSTGGASGCKMEVGLYNSSGTLVIHSGVVTDATTVKCNGGAGTRTLTSGTSPAATGLGSQYSAGWYDLALTSNETTIRMRSMNLNGNIATMLGAVAHVAGQGAATTNGVLVTPEGSVTNWGGTSLPVIALTY